MHAELPSSPAADHQRKEWCCACENSLADDSCTGGIFLRMLATFAHFAASQHDKALTRPQVDTPAILLKKNLAAVPVKLYSAYTAHLSPFMPQHDTY